MALAITNANGRAFFLRIDLDPLCAHLVESDGPISEEPELIEKELSSTRLMNEKFHESMNSLVLGQDTVTALVKQSRVFGQELYEVKIFIVARDKTAS